jgi:DNA-binding MarR family transcriptional regulator
MAPQRPIGFWLKLVDELINQQFAATLEEHGVTRRQWQLMNMLTRQPATLAELDEAIAPFLDRDEAESSAEHLEELVESEWVSLADGRYALTERGQTSFSRLSEVVGKNRDVISAGISSEEYDTTLSVLERMANNLGWQG